MKTETVTYDLVRKVIDELVKSGEKITIANVLAKAGGSAGKIAEFVKRWKSEQHRIDAYSISDQMIIAVIEENKMAVEKAVAGKNQEISEMQELLRELQEINLEHEVAIKQMDDLKSQLGTAQEKYKILEQQLKESRDAEKESVSELLAAKHKITTQDALLSESTKKLTLAEAREKNAQLKLVASAAKIEQMEKQFADIYDKLKIK